MTHLQTLGTIVLLSLIAGLGTGLGGMIAILRTPGRRSFGFLMGIAAGVMISLSFLELVNEAWETAGYLTATIGFGLGAVFMFALDLLVPHIRFAEKEIPTVHQTAVGNPDCFQEVTQVGNPQVRHFQGLNRHPLNRIGWQRGHRRWENPQSKLDNGLFFSGILIAIGITIHNIPEGIAVGAGFMHLPKFGYFIALAILLHNIPEGIAVALPLCSSGLSKWRSFRVALFSGLVEPIGALIAAIFLTSFHFLIPGALAFAGGVMVFITLDELVPVAREHGHQHFTAMGIITGAIFVFLLSGIFGV